MIMSRDLKEKTLRELGDVDEEIPEGGRIRFEGGPFHNQIIPIDSWHPAAILEGARYRLTTAQTPMGAVFLEYRYVEDAAGTLP